MMRLRRLGFMVALTVSALAVGGVAMGAVGFFVPERGPVVAAGLAGADLFGTDDAFQGLDDDRPAADHEQPAEDEKPSDEWVKDEKPSKDPVRDEEPSDDPVRDEEPSDDPVKDEADTTPPHLVIASPVDGAHVDDEVITFRGETEPGASVWWSKYQADVAEDGRWWITLKLEAGKNHMVFVAKDAAGNTADAAVVVYYEAPQQDEPKKEPVVEFTAHQKWEIVDEDPAVNVYWGTTDPGAKVWIASAHGTTYTYADDAGHWETEAAFEAPCNTWFEVAVESGDHRKAFEMKRACAEVPVIEFTAHQKWEMVDGAPAVNVYWGTAPAGTVVEVGNEYGSATATATAAGEWEVDVAFDALCNQWVAVDVSNGEVTKTFEMKRVCIDEEEEPAAIPFTANQQYGECTEPVPYDHFWGTAEPGTVVTVSSSYGGGDTVADTDGTWELTVEFPTAPRNEVFTVTVADDQGETAFFSFVAVDIS